MHLQMDEYYRKYGKVFTVTFIGRIPNLGVADPEMLKDIFVKEFDCFSERPVSYLLNFTAVVCMVISIYRTDTY